MSKGKPVLVKMESGQGWVHACPHCYRYLPYYYNLQACPFCGEDINKEKVEIYKGEVKYD